MMKFDLPANQGSIIKVIGVGGGGSNAVNHMFRQGIKGVDFIVCNTDQQALDISPVPSKIVLGASLTKGRGAGSIPEVGKNAAIENIDDVRKILADNTQMVFITAGMGGGTGTGAAPIIAQIAKEMGILTVGIVTVPFGFEGKKRKAQAEAGLEAMKAYTDTLLVICNDKLREIYGNLKLGEAFAHADDVLTTAAKGIADIITTTLHINTDFADITTVMKESGVAIMGTGVSEGEGRAIKAVELAMHSPLLNDNDIRGARYVLINIMCGTEEITMDELGEITDFIQDSAGQTAEIIKGYGIDEALGNKVKVTLIATGFTGKVVDGSLEVTARKPEKIVHSLIEEKPKAQPVQPIAKVEPKVEPKVEAPIMKVEAPVAKAETPVKKVETPIITKVEPKVEEPVLKVVETPVAKVEPKVEPKVETPVVKIEAKVEAPIVKVEPKVEPKVEAPVAKVEPPVVETPVAKAPPIIHVLNDIPAQPIVVTPKVEEKPVVEEKVETPVAKVESMEPFLKVTSPVEEKKEEEKQVTIEFEITNNRTVVSKEVVEETPTAQSVPVAEASPVESKVETAPVEMTAEKLAEEEQRKKAQERILKLKELSFKLKSPSAISEMENEPAYKRKSVDLDTPPHSSESQISRFTLTEGDDKKIEIKPNNSFLHDNVD